MPRNLKDGDRVGSYTITQVINKGAMAIAYAAVTSSGKKIFLKQYKSPTITVSWYKGYVKYQDELKQRVEATRAGEYCYKMLDFFEYDIGHKCYFQAFEFVEKGQDLEKTLERIQARPKAVSSEQRLMLAKVLMAGINAIHEARVVHTDLKPPNIQLIEDSTIVAKYRLKLIDMDYSILTDRRAPWDGHQGYIGSPNYYSPEHLKGNVPTTASDVFTCGLILYELVADGHPYRSEDPARYEEQVRAYRARKPSLVVDMSTPATKELLCDTLYRCLSPNEGDRPSAKELNLALNGRLSSTPIPPKSSPAAPPLPPVLPPPPEPRTSPIKRHPPKEDSEDSKNGSSQLKLVSENGSSLQFAIQTDIGRDLCKAFGEDSKYCSTRQFVIMIAADGKWRVVPCPEAANETLLNGKCLSAPTILAEGDILAVGREAKGIVKMPLTVKYLH